MKATFLGKDESMGFNRGDEYDIELFTKLVKLKNVPEEVLIVKDRNSRKMCPYESMKAFNKNWFVA